MTESAPDRRNIFFRLEKELASTVRRMEIARTEQVKQVQSLKNELILLKSCLTQKENETVELKRDLTIIKGEKNALQKELRKVQNSSRLTPKIPNQLHTEQVSSQQVLHKVGLTSIPSNSFNRPHLSCKN